MSKQFIVKVYSPKGLILEKSTEYLRVPGKSGDIGIFVDHTPSLLECVDGELELKTSNHTHGYFMPHALVHVEKEAVTVFANYVEAIENIDKKRAELSKERAEKRIAEAEKAAEVNTTTDINLDRAKDSLNRAELVRNSN